VLVGLWKVGASGLSGLKNTEEDDGVRDYCYEKMVQYLSRRLMIVCRLQMYEKGRTRICQTPAENLVSGSVSEGRRIRVWSFLDPKCE